MKNKKSIYKLFLLLAVVFVVSCDDSDDVNDVVSNANTVQGNSVFIETDDVSEGIFTLTGLNAADEINISVNQAIAANLTPGFTVYNYADSSTAVLGTDYTISVTDIAAGSMNSTAQITFLTDGIYEVVLDTSSDASVDAAGNSRFFSTDSGSYRAVLTWTDATVDLDMDLDLMTEDWQWGFVTFDSSSSSTAVDLSETVELLSVAGQGNLALWFWGNNNTAVDYKIQLFDVETALQVGDDYLGTFPAATNAWRLWFSLGADGDGNSSIIEVFEEDPAL
ncbi:hypothetical protein [Lacinutrix himadriensis]|uniref:hypothetical protein n=1 Tax=Lacinutrix himadriensis TaxID=641549 RepID=UPI0006E16D33|nr:hypothetical protein [Lacinutrix himadriensis]